MHLCSVYLKTNKKNFQNCIDYLSNFEKLRIDKNNNWFEGASVHAPSTNCAIESFNAIFKRFYLDDLAVSPSKLVDAQYKMFAKYDSLIYSEKPLYSNENVGEHYFHRWMR